MIGKRKEKILKDQFTHVVRVAPNDVIIIKDDDVASMEEEAFQAFVAELHEHFPENLVVVLGLEDSFETTPVEILRAMLQDLIANQEAVEALNDRDL